MIYCPKLNDGPKNRYLHALVQILKQTSIIIHGLSLIKQSKVEFQIVINTSNEQEKGERSII